MEIKQKQVMKALFVILLEIVIISFIYAFYGQVVNDEMHYGVVRSEATIVTVGQEHVIYPISFFEGQLQSYKINATATGDQESLVYFEILTDEGETLLQGSQSVADINNNQALVIGTSNVALVKDCEYQVKLWGDEHATIDIQEFQGGLVGTEIYNFMYERQLKGFCIFLVGLSIVVLSIIVYGKGFWLRFFLIAICINALQNIASIPCSAPDDFRHFLRAYDIASGNIKCQSYNEGSDNEYGMIMAVAYIPEEYAELTDLSQDSSEQWWAETNYKLFIPKWCSLFQKSESANMVECAMLGTSTISPLAYIPQIIAIWIARHMGMAPIMVYYMARFGNFLFSIAMTVFAIKLVPQRKMLFTVLYFVPGMNLLRASCSTDSMLYACVMLILALFLKLWDEEKKIINLKQSVLVAALAIVIGCIKLPYILVTAIFLFLPIGNTIKELFNKECMQQFFKNVLFIMLSCIVAYIVYSMSTRYFSYSTTDLVAGSIVSYMFENMGQVVNMLLQYLFGMTFSYLKSGMCGQIASAEFVSISYILLICWVASTERGKREMPQMVKGLILCLVLGLTLVIYFVFFTISDPTSGEITGIQGRYLLPIFALVTIVIPEIKAKCENIVDYKFAGIFAIGMIQMCCSLSYYIG